MVRDRPGNGALKAGSRATPTYEPRQVRKEAAVSGRWWVPRGCLTGATGPCDDRAVSWTTAGARSPLMLSGEGRGKPARARRHRLPVVVPQVSSADARRGHRPGPRDPRAGRRRQGGPPVPRLPLLWASRDREDVDRQDPGPDGQLREGPHARTVRGVRAVSADQGRLAPGR